MEAFTGISKSTLKILSDITGEPRVDVALHITLKDAIEHRLEKINKEIKRFESEYHGSFEEFEKSWKKGKVEDRYSYKIEKDYWDWEALVTRKKKLEEAFKWVS